MSILLRALLSVANLLLFERGRHASYRRFVTALRKYSSGAGALRALRWGFLWVRWGWDWEGLFCWWREGGGGWIGMWMWKWIWIWIWI